MQEEHEEIEEKILRQRFQMRRQRRDPLGQYDRVDTEYFSLRPVVYRIYPRREGSRILQEIDKSDLAQKLDGFFREHTNISPDKLYLPKQGEIYISISAKLSSSNMRELNTELKTLFNYICTRTDIKDFSDLRSS